MHFFPRDGKGVIPIASAMTIGDIEIKQANEQDSQPLFEWRNHPTIRAVSRNKAPIIWEDHQKWLRVIIDAKDRELLIGIISDQPVGVVRFDIEGEVAEVSIYLVPDGGFAGQGRNLLLSAERWLKTNRPDIKSIRASVLSKNNSSINLFISSDYLANTICYQKDL